MAQNSVSTERRTSYRMPCVYPVVVSDRRGRFLSRGRTSNISETGVMAIVNLKRPVAVDERLIVELSVPSASASRDRQFRTVVYACRVARIQSIGQLTGLGIEFLEKLR